MSASAFLLLTCGDVFALQYTLGVSHLIGTKPYDLATDNVQQVAGLLAACDYLVTSPRNLILGRRSPISAIAEDGTSCLS